MQLFCEESESAFKSPRRVQVQFLWRSRDLQYGKRCQYKQERDDFEKEGKRKDKEIERLKRELEASNASFREEQARRQDQQVRQAAEHDDRLALGQQRGRQPQPLSHALGVLADAPVRGLGQPLHGMQAEGS